MTYKPATNKDIQAVYDVVQHTIKIVYPKYYPAEVVDFFCEHHSKDAIAKDIENGYVSVLKIDEKIVATGCFVDNHITRVYVLPEYQKKGYGTFIIKSIEAQIAKKYDRAYLDASLPAAALYEKLGFSTIKHERFPVKNGVILAYEVMEKKLWKVSVENPVCTLLNENNEKDFYALAVQYLPGSSQEKMKKYAAIFPKAFIALTLGCEVIGIVFGWDRRIEFPEDNSFILDGIAVKYEYEKRGYGKILLKAFEKAAGSYGASAVSLGSAGGYVEKFYMECGYIPKEYKVWKNGAAEVEKVFDDVEEYYAYQRKSDDGFVVMEKKLR